MDQSAPIEFGKFRLVRKIAVGGMAEIFLAVQRGPHGFEKVAVLKVILPELCTNDEFVQMFLDEARIAAQLDHSNVVRVYDFGEFEGRYYIAMEHLPGEDLASIIQLSRRASQWVPMELAADMLIGAANGLHFAHESLDVKGRPLNIVHRDVSPSNIIVTYHGTVKLVDFGIARAESNITRTAAGTLKGKISYVSPEQAAGDPVDRRSDVFALGTVLYEMVAMRRAFRKDSDLATLKAIVTGDCVPMRSIRPDVAPALELIVTRALARAPGDRQRTAQEFADELSKYLAMVGYQRKESALSKYLEGLVDGERRTSKLQVSEATLPQLLVTPPQLRNASLTPVRGNTPLTKHERGPTRVLGRSPLVAGSVALAAIAALSASAFALLRPSESFSDAGAVGLVASVEPTDAAVDLTAERELLGLGQRFERLSAAMRQSSKLRTRFEATFETVKARVDAAASRSELTVADSALREFEQAFFAERASPESEPVRVPQVTAKGKLTIDSSPWSEVWFKGRKLGDTPLVDFSLPVGLQVLTLVNEGRHIRAQVEVQITANKTTVKKLKF